jgi:SOS-response transcriptional repressor LexA
MLDHLSTRTRQVVAQLLDGNPATLGGCIIAAFSDSQKAFLQIAATGLASLASPKGGDLLTAVTTLLDERPEYVPAVAEKTPISAIQTWKLGKIRAQSFRGVAPAGCAWEYDFASTSHLLHGPNGCGKTSLLGAICWCLTGKLFRDDCPPAQPEAIPVYSRGKKSKLQGTRPDALTVLCLDGATSSCTEPYFVDLEFVCTDKPTKIKWVRRHSEQGLATSIDGTAWTPVEGLNASGLNALDIELQILMPARVGHLRFGKDSEALSLFSQLVGLDDLETIADIASRCHKEMVKEATYLEKNRLTPCRDTIAQTIDRLGQSAAEQVKNLPHYAPTMAPSRTATSVGSLKQEIQERLTATKEQLATDLGITIPEPNEPDFAKTREQLNLLPGHIDTATSALSVSMPQLMPTSLGRAPQTAESLIALQTQLNNFQQTARKRIEQRLEWALTEQKSAKAGLMLMAAEHFLPDQPECPVCAQEIGLESDTHKQLSSLQSLTGKAHLKQSLADLENALIAELDAIVSAQQRRDALPNLGERLRQDWITFKETRFLGLVRPIADKFDERIFKATGLVAIHPVVDPTPLVTEFADSFPNAFVKLDRELGLAITAMHLEEDRAKYYAELTSAVTNIVGLEPTALLGLLLVGKNTNQEIKDLAAAETFVDIVLAQQITAESLGLQIALLQERAQATKATKALGDALRQETINVVKAVEPLMRDYYERLYDSEYLVFDMVTTGHAANPNVKDEFNIYVRAGETRLPASPFANAGRLRAIALCFVFALQQRSSGTLGVVVLDDPAMSLDDEHKARFVDHLVTPKLADQQVILATHYESFFECAEPCFTKAERLRLAPRRKIEDSIVFDPADLLLRVERALHDRSTTWRELGNNLRIWAERTLGTLSGYCPVPFVVFNDLRLTIENYASISDLRVASKRRDKIVAALKSPEFERVKHKLAHNEAVVEADVKDGLAKLMGCRKEAEAEIDRFKELFRHELLKRRISPRPALRLLSVDSVAPPIDLPVKGRAAAASNGVGITWIEPETLGLTNYQVVLAKEDVIAPVALSGQYLLLASFDNNPTDGDLVAAETSDGKRYIRRFWHHDGEITLEATNPTAPVEPVSFPADEVRVRRVVGVLFDGPSCKNGGIGSEWVVPGGLKAKQFDSVFGMRVDGTSLEPIARDGQTVLAKKADNVSGIHNGELACIDIQDTGTVLKRCYPFGDNWILCPVNPVVVENPMLISASSVLHAYRLVGVLFEAAFSQEIVDA